MKKESKDALHGDLDEYARKRNFARTPEPRSRAGEMRSRNIFVIHKHAARTLHYDLRLELNGVLKSWAVPKGPSLNPRDKRLAVQVEDHPVDYASFEGAIPEGEYGAGTVMIWDRGFWIPTGDAAEGFERGALKFELIGKKLRGQWALVRMNKGRDGKENWLLIKERDEGASNLVVTEEMPLSAKSNRTMEEIALDQIKGGKKSLLKKL